MNILFICSRNQWRSPTGETIYKSSSDHSVRSAGTEPSARRKVSAKDILWSEIIFAMEKKHKDRLWQKFPNELDNKTIIVLDIADDYKYMDEELVEMIKNSVDPFLK